MVNRIGPNTEGHCSILKEIERHPILAMAADRQKITYSFIKPFEVKIPTREEWRSKRSSLLKGYVVYTDGAKTERGTGAGVFAPGCRISVGLGRHATVLQTEIVAITMAAQELLQRGHLGEQISIVTDSKRALTTLSSCEVVSRVIWGCLQALEELGKNNRLTLVWVPGHTDIKGNQRADELAKKAREVPLIGPEPTCGIAYEVIKQEAKNILRKRHEKSWRLISGQNQSKAFLDKPTSNRAKNLLNMSRTKLRIMTGLITGHCRLNKHLYNMGLKTDPTCRGCLEEEETPIHLLCHCEAYVQTRKIIFGAERLTMEERELSYEKILAFFDETELLQE